MPDALQTIFDHIPKTGGTSITAAIARGLGKHNVVQITSSPHHVVAASLGSRRALCGHLWFYAGELLVSDWLYASLLRDPLDRFLSQYYFHRLHRQQVLDRSVTDPVVVAAVSQDNLESYLLDERPHITYSYSNVQAAHFASRMYERPYELSEAQLLDAAITGLRDYDLVGAYTEIGTFLARYCDFLGVPRQELPRLNVTHGRRFVHETSCDTRRKLVAANRVDLALVNWARCNCLPQPSPATRTAVSGVANFGTREIEIRTVECWEIERTEGVIPYSEHVCIRLKCRSSIREDDLTVGIGIHNAAGQEVLGVNSKVLGLEFAVPANSEFVVRIEFNACFPAGDYRISLALVRGYSQLDRCFHWLSGVQGFRVEPRQTSGDDPRLGATFVMVRRDADDGEMSEWLERATSARDQLRAERDVAAAERDQLGRERDVAVAERDQLSKERDVAVAERDQLSRERDVAVLLRGQLRNERDAAIAEVDAMRASSSWRITAPARRLARATGLAK